MYILEDTKTSLSRITSQEGYEFLHENLDVLTEFIDSDKLIAISESEVGRLDSAAEKWVEDTKAELDELKVKGKKNIKSNSLSLKLTFGFGILFALSAFAATKGTSSGEEVRSLPALISILSLLLSTVFNFKNDRDTKRKESDRKRLMQISDKLERLAKRNGGLEGGVAVNAKLKELDDKIDDILNHWDRKD